MLTARQARGSQNHTVIVCLFRRYQLDNGFLAHSCDPGKLAVMLSRVTQDLVVFHEANHAGHSRAARSSRSSSAAASDPLSRLEQHLWHTRATRNHSYEVLDETARWSAEDVQAWDWQQSKPWMQALVESDSDEEEELSFADIFKDESVRALCDRRDNERQIRRALPRRTMGGRWVLIHSHAGLCRCLAT